MHADDLALIAESEEKLLKKIKLWKKEMEEKGLRVNLGKTQVMKCQVGSGQAESSGKWPCGVCRKGVGRNSICCAGCKSKRCSGKTGRLQDNIGFRCSKCVANANDTTQIVEKQDIKLAEDATLE